MSYVIGVDGGNSKTIVMVADERGHVLSYARGPGSSHQAAQGLDGAMLVLDRLVREALDKAGLEPGDIAIMSCGLAGADLPEDFELLLPALEGLHLADRVTLRNDSHIALRSGTHSSWGVVIICGSGFNAAGRAPDGREITFPAIGWLSGDWGGGGTLAIEAVRAVMRADDGRGEPTVLTDLILEKLDKPCPYELMRALYHREIDHQQVLGLTPLVFEAALMHDRVAQDLLVRMGEELGVSASAIIRRLNMEDLPVEVVLGGSVFKGKGPLMIDTVRQVVHRTAPEAMLVRPRFEPVVGAVLLGIEVLGVTVTDEVYDNLHATMPEPLRMPHADREAIEPVG